MKKGTGLKGLIQWIPFLVVIGILYYLGSIDFQIHHTILFLLAVLLASVAVVVFVPIFTGRED